MGSSHSESQGFRSQFQIRVMDQALAGRDFVLHDQRVLGRQVAQVSGHTPVETAIILRQREGHPLTEVQLDELIDLHPDQVERFVVGQGDRTYLMNIDGVRSDWAWRTIGASVVRELAGRGDGYEVVLERTDVADRVLVPTDTIDLGEAGIERFFTRPAEEAVVVKYNSIPFKIRAGAYTTEALILIFGVQAGYVLDLIPPTGDFRELQPGQTIEVVGGLQFASHAPVGQSS